MSTLMGIKAQELGVDLRGMTVSVQKEMSKDAPRRIVGFPSEVHIPLPADHPQRDVLEQTALNCPVHKSLPRAIHHRTNYFWGGQASVRLALRAVRRILCSSNQVRLHNRGRMC